MPEWLIGFVFGALSTGIGGFALYYQRKSTLAQLEPDKPTFDLDALEPIPGAATGWYEGMITVRNIDANRWKVDSMTATAPKGAKLSTNIKMLRKPAGKPYEEPIADPSALTTDGLSSSCKIGFELAPKGTHSGTLIRGTNDTDHLNFLLFAPGARSVSIDFSLRCSALDDKTFKRTLHAQIIDSTNIVPN